MTGARWVLVRKHRCSACRQTRAKWVSRQGGRRPIVRAYRDAAARNEHVELRCPHGMLVAWHCVGQEMGGCGCFSCGIEPQTAGGESGVDVDGPDVGPVVEVKLTGRTGRRSAWVRVE